MNIKIKYTAVNFTVCFLLIGILNANAQMKVSGSFTSGSLFSSSEKYGVFQSAGQAFVGSSSNGSHRILSGTFFGNSGQITDVSGALSGIPAEYSISQNYPNPFNPSTKIKFALPQNGQVKICVYDILGREVRSLLDQELNAGYHELNFNAVSLPSGIYFYNIRASEFVQTKKMILLK